MDTAFKVIIIVLMVIYFFDSLATDALKYRIASGAIGVAIGILYIVAKLLL